MKDIINLSNFDISEIAPLRDNVIIELPDGVGESFTHKKTGLVISTTLSDDSKYYPVYGEIINVGDVKKCRKGDIAFFPYLTTYVALNRPRKDGTISYDNSKTIFTHNDKQYLVIPETQLLFVKRGTEIISLNNWVLLKHIEKQEVQKINVEGLYGEKWQINATSEGMLIKPELSVNYYENKAEVISAPEDTQLQKGDIVATVKHWDVDVENELMETIGYPLYYIDKECVIKYDDKP